MTGNISWLADLRGAAGPVLDQGNRGTCLSCACSSAHHHVTGDARSVEFLHYESKKQPLGCGHASSVGAVLATKGQPPESQWPYDMAIDEAHVSPLPPPALPGPFTQLLATTTPWPDATDLVCELEKGRPVVIGLRVTRALQRLGRNVLTEPGAHLGGHAVLLIGAARYVGPSVAGLANDDLLMCIQNSWGTSWGVGGFGLIGPRAWADMVLLSLGLASP